MNDMAQAMTLTDSAASKVRKLRESEGSPDLKLRVYITGGGCSGFSYGFTFDEETKEGDSTFINGDVTMLVDPMSFQYLAGSEVDYTEGLQGSQFVINNPNATSTCGCGSSFSV
ncbi:MAG: iron-sulfur cluster insertion protein ErpA [Moraxellaceae bacterium]|jgi:iron-sulfur cluster insertion protein|nr:iron-sulfur cluster insertion protein ErpA [Moraxellaceae bacterium]MBP8852099.1 iron-sulfur cluster insertion protein ErpA [Moraxellaceae bacterium]MBP9044922.1 iron-sulfur cluster insertion protein ErpA [Moraxellaceae bacterium]MBP9731548.1 iron-sulfur cluster insertion protein ErpA [Moraxellaceae bacterium]MCC6200932.1 iron-sulfur cluster insertion protein ErpA [Moraxellaceae bacterium]